MHVYSALVTGIEHVHAVLDESSDLTCFQTPSRCQETTVFACDSYSQCGSETASGRISVKSVIAQPGRHLTL